MNRRKTTRCFAEGLFADMIKTGNFLPPDRPAQGMRADEILQKGSGIDMKADIGEIICQCRQNRKMTQEEFASRLGVTPQAVSKWERGIGLPDLSLVRGICQKIGRASCRERV